jgi:hypothetical protein
MQDIALISPFSQHKALIHVLRSKGAPGVLQAKQRMLDATGYEISAYL